MIADLDLPIPKLLILARRRCRKLVPFCGGRSIESMLSWPSVPSAVAGKGDGKLPRASMKGGNSSAAEPEPALEPGDIDRLPTMMIGTMRPYAELLGSAIPAELGDGSCWPTAD